MALDPFLLFSSFCGLRSLQWQWYRETVGYDDAE